MNFAYKLKTVINHIVRRYWETLLAVGVGWITAKMLFYLGIIG